jgi:hypothetical protein
VDAAAGGVGHHPSPHSPLTPHPSPHAPTHPTRTPPQIGLRNVYYPYLIYAFYNEWRHETAICGTPWNPILLTPVCQAFLSGLNYFWTTQLLVKVLRRPAAGKGKGGGKGAGSGGAARGKAAM